MSRGLLVLGACLCLALSACGSDDDGEPAASAGAAAAATTTGAASSGAADGDIGDAVTADAAAGGAEEESAPDVGLLDDLPEEGVGSGQTTCVPSPAEVTAATVSAVRDSILCLMNAERTSRGLKPLKSNAKLAKAGNTKAADMVRRQYFAHDTPDGKKFTAGIKAAGYAKGARRWSVGENLGWGAGPNAVPERMIETWLASPAHRANMLSPKWSEAGIGVALGSPKGTPGATYATEFGKIG